MPIITISRGSASGGLLLAQGLADRLGYELVSREDITQQASRFGVSEVRLQEAILKPFRFLDRLSHERRQYLAFVQEALCERANEDRLIYHGNAGHLLLRGISHVVCIRLIAPLSYRIKMVMERQGLSNDDAVRYIQEKDRQRRDWTRFLYGVNWLDPSFYDLTINLQTLAIDSAVEIAAMAVERPEFQLTDASRKAMADLLLASRVRAALAANRSTAPAAVDVRADEDVVYLKGRIRPASMVDDVIDVAAAVPGVARVDRRNLDAPEFTV
ncbi:MAG: cytidylate kinase family protein [Gemmatimonadota bacterium]|jgi:cytidylate kinase